MKSACRLVTAATVAWGLAASAAQGAPPPHAAAGGLGAQVRILAHGEREAEEGPGIGREVSAMAHERNAARAEARVVATIVDEKPAKGRGRGKK